MFLILSLLLSYLIGAIPTAFIFGKIKGIDIRKHGSGNVGATNAFRTLGAASGIAVLLLDALKGLIPPVFIADFLIRQGPPITDQALLRVALGVTAVLGHSFTVFLKFKGGKGMATTLGLLIGLCFKFAPLKFILLIELAIWVGIFLASRIVSLASLVSAVFFPVFFIIFDQPDSLTVMSFLLSALIVYRHKSNIIRLLQRKEPRINLRRPA